MQRKLFHVLGFMMLFSSAGLSQGYVGGGYAFSSISQSGRDDVTGFAVNMQKEFVIDSGRWSFIAGVQATFLNSNVNDEFNPLFASTLTLAPTMSYALIQTKYFSAGPYAGPYLGRLMGISKGDDIFVRGGYLNEWMYGVELGLSFVVVVNSKCQLKLNPLNIQVGNDNFRQGSISLLLKL